MLTTDSIVSLYWRQNTSNRTLRAGLLMIAAVCLLTVSAQFKVPYYPVPMTMQTFVVLLLGMTYGSKLALGSVIAYLCLGAAGAPVFSGGGGIAYFTGPTGGFLLGFVAAVAFTTIAARWGVAKNFFVAFIFLAIADMLIFICGIAQLTFVVGDLDKALALGFYPFIIGDLSKVLLVAAVVVLAYKKRPQH
ncbi:MAG: biotin transporter BioY [Proteobacteria bacterium]|nr:biotin transporter BioY [Pseudomonadota bacterium]